MHRSARWQWSNPKNLPLMRVKIGKGRVNKGILTSQVPRIPFQSLYEWTEQWKTPSGPHIAPQGGHTGPAGVCGISHCTG